MHETARLMPLLNTLRPWSGSLGRLGGLHDRNGHVRARAGRIYARVNARSRACTLASLPGTRARHRGSPTPTHPPDPTPPFRALSSDPTRAAAHPSADDRSARSLPYEGGEGAARRRRRRWRWQRRRRRRRRPRTAWLAQDCPLRELKRGPTTPPPQRWCDGTSSAGL